MEIESPPQGQPDGLGFWHPALRPDSHLSIDSARERRQQGTTAWNLGKSNDVLDDDPNIARNSSFLEVTPLHHLRATTPHNMSHLQVEDGMKGDEGKETVENDRREFHVSMPLDSPLDFNVAGATSTDSNESLKVGLCSPGHEEVRFEEGIPVVPMNSHEENSAEDKTQNKAQIYSSIKPFGIIGEDPGDFFRHHSKTPYDDSFFSEPQTRDGRATIQVQRSPQSPPRSHYTTHGAEDSAGNLRFNPESTTESMAVSACTVVSQESDKRKLQERYLGRESLTIDPKIQEADLAAMWEAALDDDELLEDDEQGLDPPSFFEDDGEGFLEELPTNQTPAPISQPFYGKEENLQGLGHSDTEFMNRGAMSQARHLSALSQPQINPSSGFSDRKDITMAYPHLPADISYRSSTAAMTGPSAQHPYSSTTQAFPRPRKLDTAQSFSDKSKGGYTSPYDLPMELTRPKKRTHLQQMQTSSDVRTSSHISPPPRSSSMYSGGLPPSIRSITPPFAAPGGKTSSAARDKRTPSANVSDQAHGFKSSAGSFFEQLPPTKPRPSIVKGKSTTLGHHPKQLSKTDLQREPPPQNSYLQPQVSNFSSNSQQAYKLLPPERMGLYAHTPHQEPTTPKPVISTRYSPALVRPASINHPGLFAHTSHRDSTSQAPVNRTRYSPTPVRPASTSHQGSVSYSDPPSSRIPSQGGSLFQRFDYIRPSDGRENDPLERWKGCPILKFGFGGTIVTSFPKQIPRYQAGQSGQTVPMIKCSAGEVNLHAGKLVLLDEPFSSFPGPLKSKSKKKELLNWLQLRIGRLAGSQTAVAFHSVLPDLRKRHDENILLWKIIRIFVEHDGVVDGNSGAMSAVKWVLSPELAPANTDSASLYDSNRGLSGIVKYEGSSRTSKPVDPEAMEALRLILLQGEREKAVWYAVDQRLWPHAMLLASTLDPNIWRQALQEFIRQEVRTFGQNTQSLASFYQILAGNWEESVDELVPPSARAGLHLVSGVARTGPARNALDGLDRWRETLTLILSNRSHDDWRALVALGQLLCSYGRTEAAHICFIFAKSPGIFGGAEDPQVSVALLGADHLQNPFDYCRDLDSILLTEVYDFASTVLAPSTVKPFSPYLQSYKLYHALILADYGYRLEAQHYCDAIMAVLKSTTKPSPYFHGLLYGALEDLCERLRQAPPDDSASWMSRPSMDKVSGSVWSRLNQFIAGDESDAGSAASGKAVEHELSGPFSRVVGDSPNTSQKASLSELYSDHPTTEPLPVTTLSNSRYAPTGQYAPRPSLEKSQTWSAQETPPQQLQSEGLTPSIPHRQYQPRVNSSIAIPQESSSNLYKPLPEQIGYPVQSPGYSPNPPSRSEYGPSSMAEEVSQSPFDNERDRPATSPRDQYREGHYQPAVDSQKNSFYELPPDTYNLSSPYEPQPTETYEPPTINGYQPPLYTPDLAIDAESPEEEKPKKTPTVNNNDDDEQFATSTTLRVEKYRKDRDVDEAFRKAAEADGMFLAGIPFRFY